MIIYFFSILLCLSPSWAKKIEGVEVPEHYQVTEKEKVPLQGLGLRTATIFKIRVYLAALYAKMALKRSDDPHSLPRPVVLDVTYLRDFDEEDVDKAWAYQFKESSQFPYKELDQHVKDIQRFFGEIKGDRKESFVFLDGETMFYENGKLVGKISGKEFQKNFLSLFFGPKPPTEDLKKGLLGEMTL